MGGHVYYSFSMQPADLLKVCYVLHRNKANSAMMPTYQRLIKKSRLRNVAGFLDSGNFFPNSIVINVDAPKKGLRFDPSSTRVEGVDSRIGVLHLPKNYRSAYIIDGQHRLYGYAGSDRAGGDEIPVVAFANLPRTEQVRLFMQINENQKAVPKNLRNTLNADLLWDSENLQEQIKALKLRIAQSLGEQPLSPLYGRIIVGENTRTVLRCITIDAIRIGLDRSNFFGTFTPKDIKHAGTFYTGNNDSTFDSIVPFLEGCFNHIRGSMPEQWRIGSGDHGFVFINSGIESLIRILSDIVDHVSASGTVTPRSVTTERLLDDVKYHLDPLIAFLNALPAEDRDELRRGYGIGGRTRYWRTLQRAIAEARPMFHPPGLDEYWRQEEKAYNEESFRMIRDLEIVMQEDVRDRLRTRFGQRWFKDGVPPKVYSAAFGKAAEKNRERDLEDEVDPWDCLLLIDYKAIIEYHSHAVWEELFEKRYTKPGDEDRPGGWKGKLSWMVELNRIRNETDHPPYTVEESEYQFLQELTEWLVEDTVDNSLV